jgi:hypothetical protein
MRQRLGFALAARGVLALSALTTLVTIVEAGKKW